MQSSTAPLSILQISDLHILPKAEQTLLGIDTELYFRKILEQAFSSSYRFDLILVTGDLAQDPCPASYQRILATLNSYQVPAICLPGNHDDYPLMLKTFNTDKISCRKQTFLKGWQLICLNSQIMNSPDGELSEQELAFLADCLISNPNCPTLVAVHHHCLATESHWLDTMMIKNSSAFLALVAKHPQVKTIINGHIHQHMDALYKNIRVMAVPSTCFQFKLNSDDFCVEQTAPGYRVIELLVDGEIRSEIFRLPETLIQLDLSNSGY
ncbi:MAG: 3',5'-cyclic-AMP phosphodiesterase [Methylococcales bacterium]